MKKLLLAATAAITLAGPALANQKDHTIVLSNWKACAIGPLSETGGEADCAAVPAWTKDPAIRPWFGDDPRVLALHGLCNAKFHRVVLCLRGWDMDGPKKDNEYLICSGVLGGQAAAPASAPAAPQHTVEWHFPAEDVNASNEAPKPDPHKILVSIGEVLQKNLVCQTGGPIRLAGYPVDPDVAIFEDRHPDLAHQWAMEGVYNAQVQVRQLGAAAVCADFTSATN